MKRRGHPWLAITVLLLCIGAWQAVGAAVAAMPSADLSGQPLSLDRAIQLALERNPDVRSAENALQAAEAARRAAVGELWPKVEALSWYEAFPQQEGLLLPRHMGVPSLSEISAPTAQQTMQDMLNYQRDQFQDWVFNIGVGINWPLYTGGRLTAAVAGARAEAAATDYRLSRIRQQLAFAVTQTYLGVVVAQRTEQAVRASIEHLAEAQSNLQEFVKVGEKPRLALLRVDTRLQQVRQVEADVQTQLVTVQGNLRRLLDLDPSGPPLVLADKNGSTFSGSEIQPMTTALDQALTERPDYQAMQEEVKAQTSRLRIAQGARLPEVNLSARAWEAHGNRTGGPIATWEPDSEIMLSVSIPIFTGGTLRAQVHQQRARLDEVKDQLASLKQRVRWEITQAYAGLRAAKAKVQAAQAGMRSADEAFRVEREKVAVGTGTVTDLLDAQAADLLAQTSFYQAQVGVRVASVSLELATGTLVGRSNDTTYGAGH